VLDQALAEALQAAAEEEPELDTQAIVESLAKEPSKVDPGEIEQPASQEPQPADAEPEGALTAEAEILEQPGAPAEAPEPPKEDKTEATEGEPEHEV
jgi:hypothetical protein